MQAAIFKSGERVVYPGHGVAVIKRVENRDVGGKPRRFYVIEVALAVGRPVESVDAELRGIAFGGALAHD